MGIFDGFFDNFGSGVLNPKGNLGDAQHASRLYVNGDLQHAPKSKFLYHVRFFLTEPAKATIPELRQYDNVVGMLVKSADLPSFSANVETKNKYNRKKNIQTNIEYNPISIDFHDDNFGTTTLLLEAYFKYYYADAVNNEIGAYGNRLGTGNTPYTSVDTAKKFRYGLDNNIPNVPFFDRIEIAQMARRTFTKYTLVNPILTDWQHDSVDNADSAGTMQNQITVQYDTVFYDRGEVEAGANGEPPGFGRADHYDTTPSPITLLGGGDVGITGIIGGVGDILGGGFDNPIQAALAGVNLVDNVENLSSEGLRESGLNIARDQLGNIATGGGIASGALSGLSFPKSQGNGGSSDVTQASADNELSALESFNDRSLADEQQSADTNLRNARQFEATASSLRARGAPTDQIERAESLARTFRIEGEAAAERAESIRQGDDD